MEKIKQLESLAHKLFEIYVLGGDDFKSFEDYLSHKGFFPEEIEIITRIVKSWKK